MYETLRRLHRGLYVFPMALLFLNAALSLYDLFLERGSRFEFYVFSAGLFAGWGSFLTGLMTLFLLKASKVARGLAFIHGFVNSIALLVLTALWAQNARAFPLVKPPETPAVVFKLLMIALLAAGTFLGRSALRKHLR